MKLNNWVINYLFIMFAIIAFLFYLAWTEDESPYYDTLCDERCFHSTMCYDGEVIGRTIDDECVCKCRRIEVSNSKEDYEVLNKDMEDGDLIIILK